MEDSERFRFMGPIRYQFSALRTTISHPTYFGRVEFALSESEKGKDIKIPECEKPCTICDGTEQPNPLLPYHWQTHFTHIIACVIPCVSSFTKWGLAPFAGVGDGTLDLALVGKVSRCENLRIMRTVSLYGGKELVPEQNANLKLFRVNSFCFTPGSMPDGSSVKKQASWSELF
jgi:ceramide kinase